MTVHAAIRWLAIYCLIIVIGLLILARNQSRIIERMEELEQRSSESSAE